MAGHEKINLAGQLDDSGFNSKASLIYFVTCWRLVSKLASLHSPLSFLEVVTKLSNCCMLLLKACGEDEEEIQEISVDAAPFSH